LRGIKEKTLDTLVAMTESKRASQQRGCYCERVREHTRTPQPSEKMGRRRRGEYVQIFEF
jgi:hypothetical protein